ncbi:MAG TPA: dihydroorotate dehydrogenase-like protein [Caldithrix abyssi]|uniref:Dihydroorotate dehydrogenase-like protein n=1 Tax=Caldithrix abyssi TaxID=187145 RepID=A0A7V4WWH7_CALAY|nr:dihydroorotate dehydrogenase-like protein [Caldithrix abyssi]
MRSLQVSYLGLPLKNPVIVASSGLTKSLGKIKACEDAGAGAVVVKSLFEEVLVKDAENWGNASNVHAEAYDYLRAEATLQYGPDEYAALISKAKETTEIPIIASLNCVTPKWWPDFARKVEKAGADAIELNIFPLIGDISKNSAALEDWYCQILETVQKAVHIPVSMKIGHNITALPAFAARLTGLGLKGLVLFNRFVETEIDIETLQLKTTFPFSHSDDIYETLRWIAILRDNIVCDLSATTGIHTSEALIQLLLAGANTVQLASVLYKKGFKKIKEMLQDLEEWMEIHEFDSIDDFRGRLSFKKTENTDLYLRTQFLEKTRQVE